MKSIKFLLAAATVFALVAVSCSKDEDEPAVAEGKMSANVDGVSSEYTVSAITYQKVSSGESYEEVLINGASEKSSFAIYIFASDIKVGTYNVPNFSDSTEVDYLKGFAGGVYFASYSNYLDYYAYYLGKSSGSVTVKSISDSNVQGSYNMILVNSLDETKTKTLKGDFNAKVAKFQYGNK